MKTTYIIEVEFGSDFQKQVIERFLDSAFSVFEKDIKKYNKKNSFTFSKHS